MVKIKFIKDFATQKKGADFECDSQLASRLVRIEKVAEYAPEEIERQAKLKEKAEAHEKRRKAQVEKIRVEKLKIIDKKKKEKAKKEKEALKQSLAK